jgi:rhodanese-related sulfurtransferase
MNLPRRLWQEVAAALVLLVLAAGAALVWQRPLITAAWRGEVSALLAAKRQERRAQQFHGIPTPDLAETYRLWQERQTLFIDARPAPEYEELHVAGAVNLPPEAWDRLSSPPLPPDKDHPLLVYCSQESCDDALKLARRLQEAGYTRVMAFTGGFREWDEAGYPVDIVR